MILVFRVLSNDCQRCWLMDADSRGCRASEDALAAWIGPSALGVWGGGPPRARYFFCARRRYWHKVWSD